MRSPLPVLLLVLLVGCARNWGDVPVGAVVTVTQPGMWAMVRVWAESGKEVPFGFEPPLLALVDPDEFEDRCWVPSCTAASEPETCVSGCTVFPHETAVVIYDATRWGSAPSRRLPLQSTIAHETLHVLLATAIGSYDAQHASPEWKTLEPRAIAVLAEQGFVEQTEQEAYDEHQNPTDP